MTVHALDLVHDGLPGAISTFVLEGREPVLVDPGPSSCLDTLEKGLRDLGLALADVRHVALTHVHLDHAGATGHLVRRSPGVTVHLHRDAADHMVDPQRLVASTRRTFGEAHDRLWGEVWPVPGHAIRAWRPHEPASIPGLRPFHAPGHIVHHGVYLDEADGVLLAGDAMGIVLSPEAPTHPPTPPPGADLDAWRGTLRTLGELDADAFAAAHFGIHSDVRGRAGQLEDALIRLEHRVREALAQGDDEADARRFDAEVRAAQSRFLPRERVDRYFDTFRASTDYRGARRWVRTTLS